MFQILVKTAQEQREQTLIFSKIQKRPKTSLDFNQKILFEFR